MSKKQLGSDLNEHDIGAWWALFGFYGKNPVIRPDKIMWSHDKAWYSSKFTERVSVLQTVFALSLNVPDIFRLSY